MQPIPSSVIWQSWAVNLWFTTCSVWHVQFFVTDAKRQPTEEKNCWLMPTIFKKKKKSQTWVEKTTTLWQISIFSEHLVCQTPAEKCREERKKPHIPETQINAPPQSHALLRLPLHVFITINIERPPSIIPSDKLLFLLYVGTVTDWRRGHNVSVQIDFNFRIVVENVRLFLAFSRCQTL